MTDMKRIEVEAEVWLDSWDNEELIEYLEAQGYVLTKTPEEITWLSMLADAKQYRTPEEFDKMFSEYVYNTLGRVV